MVNCKLGNETWKVNWSTWHERGTKKNKIWLLDRNWTHDLPKTGRGFFQLSYETSLRARPFNWVHMWEASCILLGSALPSWVVIGEQRWWILSSVMKCERWIDQHDASVGQRKILSPWQELIPWPLEHRAGALIHWDSWRTRSFTFFRVHFRSPVAKMQKTRRVIHVQFILFVDHVSHSSSW